MVEFDKNVKRIEVHVVIGCQDSRDLSEAFLKALDQVTNEQKAEGTLIDFQRFAVAGTFITPELVAELKTLVFSTKAEYYDYEKAWAKEDSNKDEKDRRKIEFFFHINAHGDAHLKEGADRHEHSVHNIEITKGAKTNCGMMQADVVAKEMEELLLAKKPTIAGIKINGKDDIRRLLSELYGFEGSLLDWIKPITDLAQHPLDQKNTLRRYFDADPVTRNMHLHITAGVQNYDTDEYLRVDENSQDSMQFTFLDSVYGRVRENGKGSDHEARITTQKPVIGLFHQSSIHDARKTVYEALFGDPHGAGKVFGASFGDKSSIQTFRPLDRYMLAGLFYGIAHLGIKEWVIMGKNKRGTDMMASRILEGGLAEFIIKHFNVKITKLPLDSVISERISADKKTTFKHKH